MRAFDLLLMEKALSPAELFKREGRAEKLLNKALRNEPFQTYGEPFYIEKIIVDGTVYNLKNNDDIQNLKDKFEQIHDETGGKGVNLKYEGHYEGSEDREIISAGNVVKTAELGGGGEQGFNYGDIGEAILVAAIATRLVKREEKVSDDDIEKMLISVVDKGQCQAMSKKSKTQICTSTITAQSEEDIIESFYALQKVNWDYLERKGLQDRKLRRIAHSAARFANESNEVEDYLAKIKENEATDTVFVKMIGMEAQKDQKEDVRLKIGEHEVNISVKTGDVKQFAQRGGTEPQQIEEFMESIFGIKIESSHRELFEKGDVTGFLRALYNEVADDIRDKISGKDPRKEAKFLKDLANGVKKHATSDKEGVFILHLGDKVESYYHLLSFHEFADRLYSFLKEREINLELDTTTTAGSKLPKIRIYDKHSGKVLLDLRAKAEKRSKGSVYIRNYVESGPLLVEIANIAKMHEKEEEEEEQEEEDDV